MKEVIAIGALGGSGTRAIAQVLIDAGVYMGDYLNKSNDNLVFTRLFKDPFFYEHATKEIIKERLSVFESYMERDHLSLKNAKTLINASFSNPTVKNTVKNRLKFHGRVLHKLFSRIQNRAIWGWKEPNTQIYIQEIDEYFNNLKYLHVIRHGLDMAFSRNKTQLSNWGYRYGIVTKEGSTEQEISFKQLEYWIQSTKDAIDKGRNMRGGFLLVNHSRFGAEPETQINRMMNFIGMEIEPRKLQSLYQIPKIPSTSGRFRKHDLGIFDQAQIDFVKDMGFDV
ncbi:MAG TPA: hypothetical protein ENF70_00845 [Deltaproteobacteria bacterium]|nr:hypothetical protein [Deltaproteobacteria bacterium]